MIVAGQGRWTDVGSFLNPDDRESFAKAFRGGAGDGQTTDLRLQETGGILSTAMGCSLHREDEP